MPLEPTLGELAVDTCPVFVGIAAGLQERRIDQLDIDAAVLHRLNVLAISTSLRAATSGSAKARGSTNFMPAVPICFRE
jgi:hypothetical protein